MFRLRQTQPGTNLTNELLPACRTIPDKRPRSSMVTSGMRYIAAYFLGLLFLMVLGILCAVSRLKLALLQSFLLLFSKQLDVLSGLDAVFWHVCRAWFTEPMCQQVVTAALVVEGRPNVSKLTAMLKEQLVDASGRRHYPRFTQHIVRRYGYLVWEDDKVFTMDHRVTLWEQGYTDSTLMVLLQELYERPFVKDHSPWEVVLLPKVPEAGQVQEYIFLLRIFHSLGDGVQMLRICESLFGNSSPHTYYDGGALDPILAWLQNIADHFYPRGFLSSFLSTSRGVVNQVQMIREREDIFEGDANVNHSLDVLLGVPVRKMPVQFRCNPFLRYLRNPNAMTTSWECFNIFLNALKTAFMAPWHVTEPMIQKKGNSSPSRLNTPVALFTGRKLLSYTPRISLQRFKTVASAFGCTINDVYLHCLTGAYQRCNGPMEQERPRESSNAQAAQEVPTYVKISTPINLLPKSGFWSENCFADLMMTLPSSSTDPAVRLSKISQICDAAKSSTAATGQLLLIHALGNHLPSFVAEFTFVDSLDLEIGATNLKGPETCAKLGDDRVIDMFLAANNLSNAAVAFSFLSYNGGARIGVTVDRVVAPNDGIAQKIANYFVEELNNLVEIAVAKLKCR